MTEKNRKDPPQQNPSEPDDDFESLSQDERAAFEKIMAEISELNLDEKKGENSSAESNVEASKDSSTEKQLSLNKTPSESVAPNQVTDDKRTKQELSADQQEALDSIMAEINAKPQEKEPEAAQEQKSDDDQELSADQQEALDSIMAEINAKPQEKEPEAAQEQKSDDDQELSADQQEALDSIMAEINAKPQEKEPEAAQEQKSDDDQELSADQQEALDSIMAEINAKTQKKEPEAAQEQKSDDDQELSADQQEALDSIMAEINAKTQKKEPEAAQEQKSDDDQELSADQQEALDSIMAEINAKTQKKEPEAAQEQKSDDDQELSADQQEALDKIMAEINGAGSKATSTEVPDSENLKNEKLSFDEFSDELDSLLSNATLPSKAETSNTASRPEDNTAPKQSESPGIEEPVANTEKGEDSAPSPTQDQKAVAAVPEKEKSAVEQKDQSYVVLKEVDAPPVRKRKAKPAGKKKFSFSTFGKAIKIVATVFSVIGIAGTGYLGYRFLSPGVDHKIPIPMQTSVQQPPKDISSSSENNDGTLKTIHAGHSEQKSPETVTMENTAAATFDSLAAQIKDTRLQVNQKIDEIVNLKAYYSKGIQEEQAKIEAELEGKSTPSLEKALGNSQIELSIRAIQRRKVYIDKLDTPLTRLKASSEDLLYLQRRTELYALLSQWVSGPSMPEYKQDIFSQIQSHLNIMARLSVDEIEIDPPSPSIIWDSVLADLQKEKNTKNGFNKRSTQNALDEKIGQEICNGNFGRKYLLTSMTKETAHCLVQWSGKDLYLNGLSELSPELAEILAQWPGEWLSLNGLKTLSIETAQRLSRWPGKRLSLNGLEVLPPKVTAALSQWKGDQLEMIGLTSIGRWENYTTRLFLSETLRRKLQM